MDCKRKLTVLPALATATPFLASKEGFAPLEGVATEELLRFLALEGRRGIGGGRSGGREVVV